MLIPEFNSLLQLLHQIENFLFVSWIRNYLNTHWQPLRLLHAIISSLPYLVLIKIVKILFILSDNRNRKGTSSIVETVPNMSKVNTVSKFRCSSQFESRHIPPRTYNEINLFPLQVGIDLFSELIQLCQHEHVVFHIERRNCLYES